MVVIPDVNTLVAAAWPNHIHHRLARRWLLGASKRTYDSVRNFSKNWITWPLEN